MTTAFQAAFRTDLPAPAAPWTRFPDYNFVGGHNAPEGVPVAGFIEAMQRVLLREGMTLATYKLESGPLGYHPLREFIASQLGSAAGMKATADEVLITSGSLQGMDLINAAMLEEGDAVIIEEANYGGVLSRLARLKVDAVGVPLDQDGMRMDALEAALAELASQGRKPKYIYTIPTVQNPTATIMPEARRRQLIEIARQYDVPIFEDDCYADLTFDGTRPPAIHALDPDGRVVYIGSFSKSIAPALRVGFVVAPWEVLSRLLSLKIDAGSGAIEQMMLGEYCPQHFDAHLESMRSLVCEKRDVLVEELRQQFGTAAEFTVPPGGIFLWVKLPEPVDTTRLTQVAGDVGIAINPGLEWSIADNAARYIRICYANPSAETIRGGIAKLANVCFETFGVPERGANVQR